MIRRFIKIALAAALVAVLATTIFLFRQHAYLQRVTGDARAMGLPTTYEELTAAFPQPPAEENAATYYREAIETYRAIENGRPYDKKLQFETVPIISVNSPWHEGDPWRPDQLALAHAFLESMAPVFDSVDAAGARETCQFYARFGTNISHLGSLRAIARSLRLKAEVAIAENHRDIAIDAIGRIAQIVRHGQYDPFLVSQIGRIAIFRMAADSAHHLLAQRTLTDSELQSLDHLCATLDLSSLPRTALTGEIVSLFEDKTIAARALTGIDRFPHTDGLSSLERIVLAVLGPFTTGERANAIEWALRTIEASEQPAPENVEAFAAIGTELETGAHTALLTDQLAPVLNIGLYMTFPVAERAILRARIAVERYRLANGSLPTSLESLVPTYVDAVPIDPFDGAPLRYITDPNSNGHLLYTIATNRQDDGGMLDDSRRSADYGVEITP